jgi:hypothetical protein
LRLRANGCDIAGRRPRRCVIEVARPELVHPPRPSAHSVA